MSDWTIEKILALAPDTASAASARDISAADRWQKLSRDSAAIWGTCRGSGSKSYLTGIDLSSPAFRCSCPSRKFPCKHALALFLLYRDNPDIFRYTKQRPAWLGEWLAQRHQSTSAKTTHETTSTVAASDEDKGAPTEQPQATSENRDRRKREKVASGLDELERWMEDVVRSGIASLQGQPFSYWEAIAARMIDAQAPGIARQIRIMADIPSSGDGWPERMLDRLGRMHLLVRGFRRLDSLPTDNTADVRTQIGWTQRVEDIRGLASVRDRWHVLGQYQQTEERLRMQRSWLRGESSGLPALVLQFAHGGVPFDHQILPGTSFDAELIWFPGATPLRAVLKGDTTDIRPVAALPGFSSLADATDVYSTAIARNPWLEQFPLPLSGMVPVRTGDWWGIGDSNGAVLRFVHEPDRVWRIISLSGGGPIEIFGEWDGDMFCPLSVVADARFVSFQ